MKEKRAIQFLILFIIISLIAAQAAFILHTGLDMFRIISFSKYSVAVVACFVAANLLLSIFIFKLVGSISNVDFKFTPAWESITAAVSLLIVISASCGAFLYYLTQNGLRPTASSDYSGRVGPVLQMSRGEGNILKDPASSMSVWWFAPEGGSFELQYWDSDISGMKALKPWSDDGKRFSVEISRLRPETEYYYKINGFREEIFSFKTAPSQGSATGVRIMCISDTATGKDGVYSFSEEINRAAFALYNKQGALPSFKLHSGDIVSRGRDLFSWHFRFDSRKYRSPYIPIALTYGNHCNMTDYGGNVSYFFNQPRYYSFTYGMAHVITINSINGIFNIADREQYEFIKSELEKHSGKRWIIVSIHVPILSTGDFNMNELLIAQFFELFRKYKVDLVLQGHDHSFDSFLVDLESDWGGTFYIVNGGGGSKLDWTNLLRKNKRWKSWIHGRNETGLYQRDEITEKYHIYGEIAWGFTDVELSSDQMTIRYYRWLDIEKYLKMSGQNIRRWKPSKISDEDMKKYGLGEVQLVKTFIKKRNFE